MKESSNDEKRTMSEIVPEIGKRFTEFRKNKKLSQQDVADITGLSRAYITQVETGRANPSFKFLYQLLQNYELSIDWLLSGRGEMIESKSRITEGMKEGHYELVKKLLAACRT